MVHGEFEPTLAAGTFTSADLRFYRKQGITVEDNGDGSVTLVIPLAVAFGFPQLLKRVGEGPVLESLGERRVQQRRADRQLDAQHPLPGAEARRPGSERVR